MKILIYLRTINGRRGWAGERPIPEDETQLRMASALGVSVPRLSKMLRPLLAEKLVRVERLRLRTLKRSPLAYSLTSSGTKMASEELERLISREVRYTDAAGRTDRLPLGRLQRNLRMDHNIFTLLRATRETGEVDADGIGAIADEERNRRGPRPTLLDSRNSIHVPRNFVGRRAELARLDEFLAGVSARLFMITGQAAIGKTSLASKFAHKAVQTVPVVFHTCREWDTLRNTLEPVAELLSRFGKNRLKYLLFGELNPLTMSDIAPVLEADLMGTGALIVLDDLQKLSFDYRPLLKIFLKSSSGPEKGEKNGKGLAPAKLITTTREPIAGVSDPRDSVLKSAVMAFELGGLSLDETTELLALENARELPGETVYKYTEGHPLYIELIMRTGLSGAAKDFRKFIGQEILKKLGEEEKAVLSCLAVFGTPIRMEEVKIPQATPEAFERLVMFGLAKEVAPDEYYLPDIVIDTIYRTLKLEDRKFYHKVAAGYYRNFKDEGNVAASIRHLLRAEDFPGALDVASFNAKALIRSGMSKLLEDVVCTVKNKELSPKHAAAVFRLRSELALGAGEFKMAQLYLERALAMVKGDTLEEGRMLAAQAHALREQVRLDEALEKYRIAESRATQVVDFPTMAEIFRGIGKTYWRKGDFIHALEYHEKSLDYLKAAEMDADYGETFVEIGLVYSRMGDHEKAMDYYKKGIEKLEKGKYLHPLARAYNNLGVQYFDRNDYRMAIECWEKCLMLAERTGNKRIIFSALINLSDPYSKMGNFDKALECLEKAKQMSEDLNDRIGLGAAYTEYGITYSSMRLWEKAFENFRKSLTIRTSAEMPYERAMTFLEYGKSMAMSGDVSRARGIFNDALAMFNKCKAEKRVKEVEDLLRTLDASAR